MQQHPDRPVAEGANRHSRPARSRLAAAVTNPAGNGYGVEVVVVPGFQGGLRGRQGVQRMIADWGEANG